MATCYPLSAGNWLQNEWPWMTLSGYLTSKTVFGPLHKFEWRNPYYQWQKCRPMNLVSENISFMQIFAGVPLGTGVKRHWELLTMAIFGDLGGYVFRDAASNNMWRYATPCRPANDCKVNDLEWLFHDKMRFRPALLESERLNVRNSTTSAILRCSVHCTIS